MSRASVLLLPIHTSADRLGVAMGQLRAGGHVHREIVGTDISSIVYWIECRPNFRRDKIMCVAFPQGHERPCMVWYARWMRFSLKRRLLEPRPRIATMVALVYLIPALGLWLNWQYCSGWKWLCSGTLLESFARPWADWLGWHGVDGSNVSVAASLGVLGARLFVLGALFLNAGGIFWITKGYQWMFRKLRNNPPRLIGMMCAVTYTLVAVFIYVDQYHCSGFLCDLYLLLAATPWSILADVDVMRGGMFLVPFMLAANAGILYVMSVGLARLFWKSA
jgi:hypothetical protein